MKFSKNFLIGAATAAHQVEGNNTNSDFWAIEQMPGSTYKEPSLDAVDHYNRYKEDITLLAQAGGNAYRFSIEWARIQPQKDEFSSVEVEHYRKVLEFCHSKKITPIVTLHHFSSPKWLIEEGGWESASTADYFAEYASYIVTQLGSLIPFICTINEANMGIQINKVMKSLMGNNSGSKESKGKDGDVQVGLNMAMGEKYAEYFKGLGSVFGIDPRNVQTFLSSRTPEGDRLIIKCHEKARDSIKSINPNINVGITLSIYDYQALPGGEKKVEYEQFDDVLHYLPYLEKDDFIGIQNYSRKIYGEDGEVTATDKTRVTKMGYEFYPEGIAGVLRFVYKHWSKPMMVTENGISTDNDEERTEYIDSALKGVHDCISEGIPVIGYMYWSLLDNFEWQLGYDQTFGLIGVDRKTQKRYPKASLQYIKKWV